VHQGNLPIKLRNASCGSCVRFTQHYYDPQRCAGGKCFCVGESSQGGQDVIAAQKVEIKEGSGGSDVDTPANGGDKTPDDPKLEKYPTLATGPVSLYHK
jgi:hypothetical protein